MKIKKKTKIEYIYKKLGINRKLPTAIILVPTGEAIAILQALKIQPLTAVAMELRTATALSALGVYFTNNAESYDYKIGYTRKD